MYVATVDLLDENKYFEKSDWPYYTLGIQILESYATVLLDN